MPPRRRARGEVGARAVPWRSAVVPPSRRVAAADCVVTLLGVLIFALLLVAYFVAG